MFIVFYILYFFKSSLKLIKGDSLVFLSPLIVTFNSLRCFTEVETQSLALHESTTEKKNSLLTERNLEQDPSYK